MDLTQALTGGGLILLLATVIGYLLNSNHKDRQQHKEIVDGLRDRLDKLDQSHEAKLDKLEARHTKQIKELETRVDNLEREVDTERGARQAAEVEAHAARLRADKAEYQLHLVHGGGEAG